jgi:hypothetical protein
MAPSRRPSKPSAREADKLTYKYRQKQRKIYGGAGPGFPSGDKLELNILSTTATRVAHLSCACVQQPGGTENASTHASQSSWSCACIHAAMHPSLQPCIPQSNELYRGDTEVSLAFRLWGEVQCRKGDASHIIDMVWLAWLSQWGTWG